MLVGGGITLGLAIGVVALEPLSPKSVTPAVGSILLVAVALLLPGLRALYGVQPERSRGLGTLAHGSLSIGLLLLVVVAATPVLHPDLDVAAGESPLLFLLALALVLGLVLTPVVVWQTVVLPRPAALLILAGAIGFAFAFFVAELVTPLAGQVATGACGVLLGAGFAWIGGSLWRMS